MRLYIKNMVCKRCITIVKSEMDKLGFEYDHVEIGIVNLPLKINVSQLTALAVSLKKHGFQLIDDQNNEPIEKLKKAINDLELYSDEDLETSLRDFISLQVDDSFISRNKMLAEIEGSTIDKFLIRHKIARVRELLVYPDLVLAEYTPRLHYCSLANLSGQFRKVTGLSPAYLRQLRHARSSNPELN